VLVARRGREPGLTLSRDGQQQELRSWGLQVLDEMEGICELLDQGEPQRPYSAALATQRSKLRDVAATPSARLLAELATQGESFFQMALRMSRTHKAYFMELHPPNPAQLEQFTAAAGQSLEAQRSLEAASEAPFAEYVTRYLSD
jgi:glutamate--cysteine ligase